MKSKIIALFLSTCPIGVLFAAEKPKLKIPHRHDSKYGGRVHMLGDSHFEVLRKGTMLMVYFYDKFGEDIAVSEFTVSAILANADKREDLNFTVDKILSFLEMFNLFKANLKQVLHLKINYLDL